MKHLILIAVCLFFITCDDPSSSIQEVNTSWTFVANEGAFGASSGSISMIDDFGNVYETEPIGDVVQSIEVYDNKLIVLINNSHLIKIYDITEDGLSMPGIEVSTEGSSPREMVILDGFVYFTNWTTSDVKVFNLFTYNIDASIPVGIMPEGIVTDGNSIWVANSGDATVSEIDIESRSVITTHEVGQGPQNLALKDGSIYVSRTYYSDDWTVTYHGASIISEEIITNNYGSGMPCGGSIMKMQNSMYRAYDGGISKMNDDLSLDSNSKIGNYNQNQVYHVEIINDNIWFTITDYQNLNQIRVVNYNGDEIAAYNVGQNPGDLTYWTKN